MRDYPFIRAAGQMHGSDASYIEDVVLKARADNAPKDAWAYEEGTSTDPRPRYWLTVSGLEARTDAGAVTARYTAARLRQIAGIPRAEEPLA